MSVLVRYCSKLRAGMGSKYTPADVHDYVALQKELDDMLSGVKSYAPN